MNMQGEKKAVELHGEKLPAYLLLATDSSLPSVLSFLFLGCGLCTKVQSWVWNWHKTQLVCPSLITHLLFLRLQASHGLSLRLLILVPDSPEVELLMLADNWALPFKLLIDVSIEGSMGWGLRAAIAIGAVRAMVLGFDMAYEARLDRTDRRPGTEFYAEPVITNC
jgi:hypothetical protein